jgi:hypothetical protein
MMELRGQECQWEMALLSQLQHTLFHPGYPSISYLIVAAAFVSTQYYSHI